ncbi:MAG TPA: type 1 glutamine amidotransferase [Candidatus Dormibacteraeota bacterium]|nr:type 1 glutamine amidotransferase [Candidatus Dormibacteraeota bacterium]
MTAKPVLCIRNDRDDNLGITQAALRTHGVAIERLDAFAPGVGWPEVGELAGLIVFGGEMNVDAIEPHPYLMRERELVARALDGGLPVLGICLGAQMLARVLGARVLRAPVRELGFKPVRVTAEGARDRLVGAFGPQACVFQWHEDTFELPEGAILLATGEAVANQAFSWGSAAWGVQFHFEVDREGLEGWVAAAGSSVERTWNRTAGELMTEMDRHLGDQQEQARAAFGAFAQRLRGS